MPEGPSIVILKEELQAFSKKKIIAVSGNSKIEISRLVNKKVNAFESWGKHLLICFDNFYLRIHMLMWGTCRINERKPVPPRLQMLFKNGEVNFYSCSIRLIEGTVEEFYDWETDVMSDKWNPKRAMKTIRALGHASVCDVLLNQDIFSGVGNIIKNEVLFRIGLHPLSDVQALSPAKLRQLVTEARNYSHDFYKWKKIYELKKHWLIYKKSICPRCKIKVHREYLGKTERLTCFCTNCQRLYKSTRSSKR